MIFRSGNLIPHLAINFEMVDHFVALITVESLGEGGGAWWVPRWTTILWPYCLPKRQWRSSSTDLSDLLASIHKGFQKQSFFPTSKLKGQISTMMASRGVITPARLLLRSNSTSIHPLRSSTRAFRISTRLMETPTAALPVRKPIGAFRGGWVLSFLFPDDSCALMYPITFL